MNFIVKSSLCFIFLTVVFNAESFAGWAKCGIKNVAIAEPVARQGHIEIHYPGPNHLLFRDSLSDQVMACVPIGFGWTVEGIETFPIEGSLQQFFVISGAGLKRYFRSSDGMEIFLSVDEGGEFKINDQDILRPGKRIAALQEWIGPHSLIDHKEYVRLYRTPEWTKLWVRHTGSRMSYPKVNFGQYMIVGIFNGEEINSPGVRIEDIRETDNEIHIYFDLMKIPPMKDSTASNPFGIFLMPHSKKDVVFHQRNLVTDYEISEWPVVHRISQ